MSDQGFEFVALSGSLRTGSFTHAIAVTLDELAPDNVAVEVLSGIADFPMYCQDIEDRAMPPAVIEVAAAISAADAVVIVSPEYNHSIPGFLKNALDWLSRMPSRPFEGKPVAIQTSSPGALGGARAHEHVRQIMAAMNAIILQKPEMIVPLIHSKIDPLSGILKDGPTRTLAANQLAALRELASASRKLAMNV